MSLVFCVTGLDGEQLSPAAVVPVDGSEGDPCVMALRVELMLLRVLGNRSVLLMIFAVVAEENGGRCLEVDVLE